MDLSGSLRDSELYFRKIRECLSALENDIDDLQEEKRMLYTFLEEHDLLVLFEGWCEIREPVKGQIV